MTGQRALLAVACALFAAATTGWACGVRFNLTASMPVGLYRLTRGRPTRGSTVLVCLPAQVAAFAKGRGYLRSGSCPDGVEPVGKVVAAKLGDSIAVTEAGILVNGVLVAGTRPLLEDARGRSLPQLRRSPRIVTEDSVWLYSPYSARSFDSRYYGPVAAADIMAMVRPILLLSAARRSADVPAGR